MDDKMIIPIKNSSDKPLEVQLEPWLNTVLLNPGEGAKLEGEFGSGLQGIEIEYDNAGCLVLYTPAGSTLSKCD